MLYFYLQGSFGSRIVLHIIFNLINFSEFSLSVVYEHPHVKEQVHKAVHGKQHTEVQWEWEIVMRVM